MMEKILTFWRTPKNIKKWSKRLLICTVISFVIYACFLLFIPATGSIRFFPHKLPSNNTTDGSFQGGEFIYMRDVKISPIDNTKWMQTSLYEIFEKHKNRTISSCRNVCDAKTELGCTAKDVITWEKILMSPKFNFLPLLSENQYIYPFEVDFMSQPPMTDSKELPDLTLSKVILSGATGGQVVCRVDEIIYGRVDLINGYGKQRIMGGDDVRVWIVDKKTKGYKAVGHVTDLRNGSYLISVRCLWPGEIQLYVAVAYPREFVRVAIHQIHKGVTWYYGIKFKNSTIEEVTPCFSTPNVPGRPCLCNFTSTNQQSLYCGRPLEPSLSCTNWVGTYSLPVPPPQQVTPAEQQLIKNTPSKMSTKLISHNFTLFISDTGQSPNLKPCKETTPSVTWKLDNKPSGYWTPDKTWVSLVCRGPEITTKLAISCLKNTNIWVFGDSNGIRIADALGQLIHAVRVSGEYWPYRYVSMNKKNGIKLTFTPLEYPLYLGKQWRRPLPYGGVANQIDSIPSTGTHVIVIHYFLHIGPSHLNIAFFRLKAVHDAIQRLIKRNPNVFVGIRGPHVSCTHYNFNHAVGGDVLGMYLLEMIRNVFADLSDKVVFLDGWEMTVAIENGSSHPPNEVPLQLIKTLLSFKCS